ncbi:MAG: hypothetical protein KIT58_02145 [Planctomycetota bacterium]|nr:hypothetical protein [Planctomycetota bacterium]
MTARVAVMAVVVAGLALVVVPPARAQEAIDADFRMFDVVVVDGVADPIEGTILRGGGVPEDPHPAGRDHRVPARQGAEITWRETVESASCARGADQGARHGGEHRLLAEWALKHGLRAEGEGELRLAAEAEPDLTRSPPTASGSIGLVEDRLGDLAGGRATPRSRGSWSRSRAPRGQRRGVAAPAHARAWRELACPRSRAARSRRATRLRGAGGRGGR